MAKDYLELAELLARIKEGVEDAFPDRYWVKAEIGSWSPRANGHCYLNLTQSDRGKPVADIRAMIWKWHFPQLKAFFEQETGQTLQAGITVLVHVQVSFSEMFGMSLFIDDIDPAFTVGEQALAKKKAIEKLTAGGYLEMQQELAIPRLPYRLAVITSKTAAGYGDFRRQLLENEAGYAFRLDLYEALMQGEQAPASIIAALAEAQEQPCDAILILRGGGSEMDLACFDDYDLAVAIATCPAPVVTAIGHDRDFHIADLVANRSVKTPTALADLFLDAYAAEDALLDDLQARVRRAVADRLNGMARKVDSLAQRLRFAAGARIDRARAALDLKEALIKASDPRKILSMGYALVTGGDGMVLKSVAPVAAGDRIGVRFADGTITAVVHEVKQMPGQAGHDDSLRHSRLDRESND
jgi:exodeoxyribonuclease VII large subunit